MTADAQTLRNAATKLREAAEYVWLAVDENGRTLGVATSRSGAEAILDRRLAAIGCKPSADGWYQPALDAYQDGTWWMRWYVDTKIVRGNQDRCQEIRRFEVEATS